MREVDEFEIIKRKYQEREDLRFRFLCRIFKLQLESDFDEWVKIPLREVGESVGLSEKESYELYKSLIRNPKNPSHWERTVYANTHYKLQYHMHDDDYPYVMLTSKGMDIVREGLGLNKKSNDELSIVKQYNISNSNVAIESPGTTQLYNSNEIPSELFETMRELQELVEQKRVDDATSDIVTVYLREIREEVESDVPNRKKIAKRLTSIKPLLMGAAGKYLIDGIDKVISMLTG